MGNADLPGVVIDDVRTDPLEQLCQRRAPDIDFVDLRPLGRQYAPSRGKVVRDDDAVPSREVGPSDVRSDEARPAGDEDGDHGGDCPPF